MTFKITDAEYTRWEIDHWNADPKKNYQRDINDYRYGQKFINDHFNKGFIHTDPALFYEENAIKCVQIIEDKYIKG